MLIVTCNSFISIVSNSLNLEYVFSLNLYPGDSETKEGIIESGLRSFLVHYLHLNVCLGVFFHISCID